MATAVGWAWLKHFQCVKCYCWNWKWVNSCVQINCEFFFNSCMQSHTVITWLSYQSIMGIIPNWDLELHSKKNITIFTTKFVDPGDTTFGSWLKFIVVANFKNPVVGKKLNIRAKYISWLKFLKTFCILLLYFYQFLCTDQMHFWCCESVKFRCLIYINLCGWLVSFSLYNSVKEIIHILVLIKLPV